MKKSVVILSWIFLMCFAWACQNDEEEVDYSVQELEVETVRNYTKGEQLFYEMNVLAEVIWQRRDIDSLNVCDYSDLTVGVVDCGSAGQTANEIVIFYGSNGIVDKDGVFKKGFLKFKFSKQYEEDSASCVTEVFYGKDTLYFEGKSTLTFLSKDSVHYLLETGNLDFGENKKCEWTANKTRVSNNNLHYFYGTAAGKNILGNEYSLTIDEPEIVGLSCSEYIPTQGMVTVDFTSDSLASRVIDYGDGECDQNVTVKIGKLLYDIVLE